MEGKQTGKLSKHALSYWEVGILIMKVLFFDWYKLCKDISAQIAYPERYKYNRSRLRDSVILTNLVTG